MPQLRDLERARGRADRPGEEQESAERATRRPEKQEQRGGPRSRVVETRSRGSARRAPRPRFPLTR